MPNSQPNSENRSSSLTYLFLLVLICTGYFCNAGSWNQNARLNTIYAFVEPGPDRFTFHFDRFMPNPQRNIFTGDWSYYDGHYYSNKAPGTAFLGIPVYAVLYTAQRAAGADIDNPYLEYANAYVINLFVSVLPLAWASVAFAQLLRSRGHSARSAALLALTLCLATLLFPYATQLWGHTTAAAFIVLSLSSLAATEPKRLFLAGCYAGLAVCCDYLAAIPVLAISLYAIAQHRVHALTFFLGAIPPALMLLSYHTICFGSPWALPTDYTNPAFIDADRNLGLFGAISPEALWQLSFGSMRGIFWTMPILLLAVPGFIIGAYRQRQDVLLYLSLAVCVVTLLLNSSFNGWHAGASVGARYQIVALPFWVLLLSALRAPWQFIGLPLAAYSALAMLATAAVSPIAPDIGSPPQPHPNPLQEWVFANFFQGKLAQFLYPLRMQGYHPALREFIGDSSWNMGMWLGLPGLWSLVPLLLVATFFLYKIIVASKTEG